MNKSIDQSLIERVLEKSTIIERMDRWLDYCAAYGRTLDHIVIHPDDARSAPDVYRGLPVRVLGQ